MGFVIAVDGPAASGKGTIATRLAALYGYPVLDSGLLYRAVGVRLLAEGGDLSDMAHATRVAETLDPATLENPEVRTRAAGEAASRVAAYTPVREALRAFQRSFAAQEPGVVIDGRERALESPPRLAHGPQDRRLPVAGQFGAVGQDGFGRRGPGGPQQIGGLLAVVVLQAEAGLGDAGPVVGGERPVPEAAHPSLRMAFRSSPQRFTGAQSRPNPSSARPTDWSTISSIDWGLA